MGFIKHISTVWPQAIKFTAQPILLEVLLDPCSN